MEANAPPKVLRTDHASVCPESVTRGGKSLAAMGLGVDTPSHPPVQQNVSDPNPLSYAWPQPIPEPDIAQSSKGATVAGDPESEKSSSFTSFAGSPCGIYQPGCGITNSCRLDTPGVCQDAVDHMVPPGFEQEVRLLKKAKEKVAKRDQRIQAREEEIKKLDQEIRSLRVVDTEVLGLRNQTRNLETLLEAEVDMKKHEDDKVEKRCAEMDARLDALSIDFDKELYPHMLTAIASRRWVEHGKAQLDLEAIEVYDPEADAKYVAVLHALKDLKYPLIDQLEKLKDLPPIDLIMTSLYFESDVREDTPEWIREIRPSSSQLKIPVYPKVRDPRVPWAFKEEMLSDGIPVLVPTVAPQGLAILLTDDATQTETTEDEASPRLIRSKSMPPIRSKFSRSYSSLCTASTAAVRYVGIPISADILARSQVEDLLRCKSVCKSWKSLISSRRFVKYHLNYNLKKKAYNNESGDTRIDFDSEYCHRLVGSSNGLCWVLAMIHKVVVGFSYKDSNDILFIVLELKSNVWRLVAGEVKGYPLLKYGDTYGTLCNGVIYWPFRGKVIVSFDLSKEVIIEIPQPDPPCDSLQGDSLDDDYTYTLGTIKDRLCIIYQNKRTKEIETWVMKNYNVMKTEGIEIERWLPPPGYDEHKTIMKYTPHERFFYGHAHIWMLEEGSSVAVLVHSLETPGENSHIKLSTISECNHNFDRPVFVKSLVCPHGMGDDYRGNGGRLESNGMLEEGSYAAGAQP
ncbi:gypsy type transposase [Tanacetum coccineum]